MPDLLGRHSLFITCFGLLIASGQLMNLSIANRDVPQMGARAIDSIITPAEKTFHEAVESAKFAWSRYIWLVNVEKQRKELLARVKELEAQNSRLTEFESENIRLRKLLEFSEVNNLGGVVATVIGRDPSNWVKSIAINKGTLDGIRPGLAVVDGNAIVGQTTAVTESTSRVLLLTDSTSAVDALVQNSRAVGTAEGGSGRNLLRLRYILKLKEYTISAGERVIASGLDGIYPKGALIGVVERVNPNVSGLFQDIEIRPSVDVLRVENVLVLLPEKK